MEHIEIIKLLLNDKRIDINAVNVPGESALSRCYSVLARIDTNIIEMSELLLNHPEIDPNIPCEPHFKVFNEII